MVLKPGVLARAQAEIDKICIDRLPGFDDWDSLPYVEAIMREALRWNPVTPEGPSHFCRSDTNLIQFPRSGYARDHGG